MAKFEIKKERKSVAIIGDGKTEFEYIESLKIAFQENLAEYSLQPRLPKNSSVAEMKRLIDANLVFDKVLCVIDMDTKLKNPKEHGAISATQKQISEKRQCYLLRNASLYRIVVLLPFSIYKQ
jgi:hypothetical protein